MPNFDPNIIAILHRVMTIKRYEDKDLKALNDRVDTLDPDLERPVIIKVLTPIFEQQSDNLSPLSLMILGRLIEKDDSQKLRAKKCYELIVQRGYSTSSPIAHWKLADGYLEAKNPTANDYNQASTHYFEAISNYKHAETHNLSKADILEKIANNLDELLGKLDTLATVHKCAAANTFLVKAHAQGIKIIPSAKIARIIEEITRNPNQETPEIIELSRKTNNLTPSQRKIISAGLKNIDRSKCSSSVLCILGIQLFECREDYPIAVDCFERIINDANLSTWRRRVACDYRALMYSAGMGSEKDDLRAMEVIFRVFKLYDVNDEKNRNDLNDIYKRLVELANKLGTPAAKDIIVKTREAAPNIIFDCDLDKLLLEMQHPNIPSEELTNLYFQRHKLTQEQRFRFRKVVPSSPQDNIALKMFYVQYTKGQTHEYAWTLKYCDDIIGSRLVPWVVEAYTIKAEMIVDGKGVEVDFNKASECYIEALKLAWTKYSKYPQFKGCDLTDNLLSKLLKLAEKGASKAKYFLEEEANQMGIYGSSKSDIDLICLKWRNVVERSGAKSLGFSFIETQDELLRKGVAALNQLSTADAARAHLDNGKEMSDLAKKHTM